METHGERKKERIENSASESQSMCEEYIGWIVETNKSYRKPAAGRKGDSYE